MKKLKLDVDELRVESFRIADGPEAGRGTVHGRGTTIQPAGDTQADTCPYTDPYYSGDICAAQPTDVTCVGYTCYGLTCGPPSSCGQGADTNFLCSG